MWPYEVNKTKIAPPPSRDWSTITNQHVRPESLNFECFFRHIFDSWLTKMDKLRQWENFQVNNFWKTAHTETSLN